MSKNIKFITKSAYQDLYECECGKPFFKFQDTSQNRYVAKCNYTKEEFNVKTRKWSPCKKQPCNDHFVYLGSKPIFAKIENIIKQANCIPSLTLEQKLQNMFRFLHVSNRTSTIDEINLFVKYTLNRTPLKTYYFPCTSGHLRVSHRESYIDFEKRIFSEKIVDRSHELNPPEVKSAKTTKVIPSKTVKKVKKIKKVIPDFIPESEPDNSDDSESERSEDSESDRSESDYEDEQDTKENETEEVEVEEEVVVSDVEDYDNYDDYEDAGDDYDYD